MKVRNLRTATLAVAALLATALAFAPAAISAGSPISCLKAAGLSSVQFRGGNGGSTGYATWRGFHTSSPFFAVIVQKLPSPAAARSAVKAATAVRSAQGGRFFVTGPSKSVNDGGIVATVARCLK